MNLLIFFVVVSVSIPSFFAGWVFCENQMKLKKKIQEWLKRG